MTNLVDAVNFVVDGTKERDVKKIIKNAHKWCRKANLRKNMAKDMLDILVKYSDSIDSQDKNWRKNLKRNPIISGSELDDLVEIDGQVPK